MGSALGVGAGPSARNRDGLRCPLVAAPNGILVVVHRAVGKLTEAGTRSKAPTHSTDCTELDEALRIGEELVGDGMWSEFYVKEIHRRRAVVRN